MKFLWKLYTGYLTTVLVAALVVTVFVSRGLERDAREEVARDLLARAALLAEVGRGTLSGRADPGLGERLRALGRGVRTRLTLIRLDGAVLFDSEQRPDAMDDHSNRPEVLAARAEGVGRSTRRSNTLDDDMMYVAVRVDDAGASLGYARAALPLSRVAARVQELRLIVLLGAAVAAVLASIPGYLIARRISEPISAITAGARAIARGEAAPPLPRRLSDDELGELARAFEAMAVQLRERMDTITNDRNELAAVLAGMVEGVVAIDADGRVVHMNDVAARLLQAAPGALGRRVWEVTRVREVSDTLTSTLEEPAARTVEVRLPAQPRDQVLELHASPLRDPGGAATGAVLVLHDVTELRGLEGVRRDFVANVSHELKTPLTTIYGVVETLLDEPDMDATTRGRFLEKVQRQADRLTTLVHDLLTLSRAETGEVSLERVRLDAREPVLESLRGLRPVAEERVVELEQALPEVAVPVLGDREMLRQAVDNLLDNAVKYTPPGGRVWLRLAARESRAVIEVQDTGIGIEPRDQARVFERFYRVDKARSRELGGTGLGLSIVKHVALAHGGEVSVDSAPGQGSTFRVTLPLADA